MTAPGGDLRGVAIIGALFFALLAGAEVWRRVGNPKPEWTRKLVHLGAGLACLLLPFLVGSVWVVLAMAVFMSGLFALAAWTGFLRGLHGVDRATRGAEYYPLAVFLAYLLAQGESWLFVAAVLTLAVGDGFAALVGTRYGAIRFEVDRNHKSVEGSLVFMMFAFLAIHLPTLLMTDLPRPVTVLAALLVATLVTGVEAVSRQGTDNLFVPLAVVIILRKITRQPLAEVGFQNLSLLGTCLAMAVLVRRFPFFNAGSTIVFTLYAYAAWSLGSWQWALPVFAGLVCYVIAWLRFASREDSSYVRSRTVGRALFPPFALLVLANMTRNADLLFVSYLACNAAVLALSLAGPVLHAERLRGGHRLPVTLGAAAVGCAVTLLPPWLVQAEAPLATLVAITAVVFPVTYLNVLLEGREVERDVVPRWTARRFVLSFAAAGAVLALQWATVIPEWTPMKRGHGFQLKSLRSAVTHSPAAGAGTSRAGSSAGRTVPAAPSMVTRWPLSSAAVNPRMPTIVGMPISRATIAECDRMLPRSIRIPDTDG